MLGRMVHTIQRVLSVVSSADTPGSEVGQEAKPARCSTPSSFDGVRYTAAIAGPMQVDGCHTGHEGPG